MKKFRNCFMFVSFILCMFLLTSCEKTKYIVEFECNGGGSIESLQVEEGSKAIKPTDPVKEGQTFIGWYSDKELTNSYDFNNPVYKNTKIYAKWETSKFNISYVTNCDTVLENTTVKSGEKVSVPNALVKSGYKFDGWFIDENYNIAYDFNNAVNKNITLYAKWSINTYTIYYITNDAGTLENSIINYGEKIPMPATLEKTGYTFAGWYTEREFINAYDFNSPIYKDSTLYAKWEANEQTVSFITNSTSQLNDVVVLYNDKLTAPEEITKDGYVFKAWYSDESLTIPYDFDLPVTSNLTLYAGWTKLLTINFEVNGGSKVESVSLKENEIKGYKLPTSLIKTDYVFSGWYLDTEFKNQYNEDALTTALEQGEITLYAKWVLYSSTLKLVINFEVNGGNNVNPLTIAGNEVTSVVLPTELSKEGYTFDDWYLDSELQTPYTVNALAMALEEGTITLYAKWNINKYQITFVTNNDEIIESKTIEYGQKVPTVSDLTKLGYTFDNWYTEDTFENVYDFNNLVDKELVLYAKWDINKYTISYVTNNDETLKPTIVEHGQKVQTVTTLEKDGYAFDAWYTENTFENAYDFDKEVVKDLVLYAKWKKLLVITFEVNGGNAIEKVTLKEDEIESYNVPTNVVKDNYKFMGWFLDSEFKTVYSKTVLSSALEKGTISIYAKWEKALVSYTVTFNANNDTVETSVKVNEGSLVNKPTDPILYGCTFVAWCTDEALTNEFDFNDIIVKDLKLYAKWDGNVYVDSVQLPTNILLFNYNKTEKTNKRTEFFDLTKIYVVGDDNSWVGMPDVSFVKYNHLTNDFDETTIDTWDYIITIYEIVNGNEVEISDDLVDKIDSVNCLIDFSEKAIGKSFKVVIIPKNLTEAQLDGIDSYTVKYTFDVVDGFNVYTAKELAYIEKRAERSNDVSWNEIVASWNEFKDNNGIDKDYHPTTIIFHKNLSITKNDVPSIFFYQESELSKSDSDYVRTLGSMKDGNEMYYHEFGENEQFHIYGNYFTLDTSALKEVTRENGEITPEGAVISHATLLRFQGSDTGVSSIQNLNMIGNAPRVENTLKSGGQIFIKVQGPSFTAYNNIAACLFITYMPNYTFTNFIMDKCKAYDAFNCFVYNWGSDKVFIEGCEMIGAGGPVIIQDHVDSKNADGGRVGKTVISNSKLESYVTGSEGWFSVVGASAVVPQIKGLDALFNPFGRSFLKYSTDKSLSYLNIICVNKSDSAEGLTAEKVKGSLSIDNIAFDFGETNPYIAALLENTFANGAPAFQTNTGGYCYGTQSGLFDLQNNQIIDPANPIYSGDYLCLYYQGMAITFGYYNVGEIYSSEN